MQHALGAVADGVRVDRRRPRGRAASSARALAGGDDARASSCSGAEHAFLILNAFPYASGHLMAVINRHVGSLEAATAEELGEAMALVQTAHARARAPPIAPTASTSA